MDLQSLKRLIETVALCLMIASVQALLLPRVDFDVALVYSLAIGLVTWLVIELGRQLFFPNVETGWPRGMAGPILVLLACCAGFLVGSSLAAQWFGHPSIWRQDPFVLKTSLMVTVLAGVGASTYFYLKGKNAWLSAAKEASDRLAVQAQLQRLSAQLQPHMLFNTLANVRALVTTQPEQALAMLDRLNTLLRTSLQAGRATEHGLAQEFAALDDYLALMQMRLGERLKVQLNLPEALRDEPILTLLAQPLVENAILHGIEPSVQGGTVWVNACQNGAQMQLDVYNSGHALQDGTNTTNGSVGLSLVSERLRQRWGPSASLSLETAMIEGQSCTRARMCWPVKNEAS